MPKLSERQQHIIEYIITALQRKSIPPTIREIGEAVGISSTSVVNYNLAKLEEYELLDRQREVSRGLTLNWTKLLELGFVSNEPEMANGTNGHMNGTSIVEYFRIPVLGSIAAGSPIQVDPSTPNTTDNWINVAQGMLGSSEDLFALKVQGDSMVDASVLDGDIVILRHQETANDGDMIAAWIEGDDETTLKFLHREGRQVRLEPANPNYEPIYRDANKVRIAGKVVSVIRVYNKL